MKETNYCDEPRDCPCKHPAAKGVTTDCLLTVKFGLALANCCGTCNSKISNY